MRSPTRRTCSDRWAALLAVSLVTAGCATSLPPTVFVPSETPEATSFYREGKPYAALEDSAGAVLLTMRQTTLAERPYLKLWLRVENHSDHNFLLDPDGDIYLERRIGRLGKLKRIEPESRHDLLELRPDSHREARAVREASLRKNTLFPGQSLEGDVYFYFPAPEPWTEEGRPPASPWDGSAAMSDSADYAYELTLHLETPGGSRHVVLKPVPAK